MIDNKETLKPFCSYSFALVFLFFIIYVDKLIGKEQMK